MSINLQDLTSTFKLETGPLKAGVSAAIAGVGALVAGVTIAAKATFDWANDLDSLGDVADGTGDGLAAMTYIARKSGVGIDAVTKATFNLNKSLLKQNGTLDTSGNALKAYGISVKDANGNVKDSVQLTDEIAKKYSELGTQQERVNFLTEVYGKSGKDMIDFFDTLAADGGIDKVAQKVRDLGLAIDPARYEQFNRNLEEMKLMGLGVAVGLTEQLMPAVEAVSGWIMTEGIPALKDFGKNVKKAFDKGGILGVADKLLDEFDKIDWSKISTTIINGINGINWSQAGMDFSALVTRVKDSVVEFFTEVDWLGLGNSLASGLNNFIAGMFGTDEAGMQTIIQTKLAEAQTALTNWANGAPSALDSLDTGINTVVTTAFTNMVTAVSTKLAEIDASFANWSIQTWGKITTWVGNTLSSFATWASGVLTTIVTWGRDILTRVATALETLKGDIDRKLSAISEHFQTRARSWINKAVDSFNGQKQTLLNTVQGLVDELNRILNKVKTSFMLTFGIGGNAPTSTQIANSSGSPDDRDKSAAMPVPVSNSSNSSEANRPLTARIPREDMYEFAMVVREMVVKGA